MEFVSASKLKTFRSGAYSLKDKFKSSPATLSMMPFILALLHT